MAKNWVKKALEKDKIHKMIQQAMNSPEYKEARNHDLRQATLRALIRFTFIALLYLEMTFRCGRKAFIKFLDFVLTTVEEIGNDEEFIESSNEYYKEKYNLDVMDYLGVELIKNDDELSRQFSKEF
jgi:hypothetical protein